MQQAIVIVGCVFLGWIILGVYQWFYYMGWLKRSNWRLIGVVPDSRILIVDEYIRDSSQCVVDVLMEDGKHYIFLAPIRFVEFMDGARRVIACRAAVEYGGATVQKMVSVHWFFNRRMEF